MEQEPKPMRINMAIMIDNMKFLIIEIEEKGLFGPHPHHLHNLIIVGSCFSKDSWILFVAQATVPRPNSLFHVVFLIVLGLEKDEHFL